MKKLLERYFPSTRSFPGRIFNWIRNPQALSFSKSLSTHLLKLKKCVMRAPVVQAAGSKILFVSDWHWHGSPKNYKILAELEKIAALAKPDVLVIGGDITEDADKIAELPALLTRLRKLAPQCIAVMGNWESGKRWLKDEFWQKLYANAGITLLRNECFTCGAVRFHGISDINSGLSALPEKLDPSLPKPGNQPFAEVIVAHSPDTVIALDDHMDLQHYDIALCGHCHGGQIRLPLLGALFCPSRYGRFFARGSFIRKNAHLQMLVSAGVGEKRHSFRLFCPPEVLLLTFRAARHYRHRHHRNSGA